MLFISSRRAFSLVELSIVLVILGLLVGGILAGQSLIRASELRSVSTEANRIMTASNAFRDKYFGLPGDIVNATSFWGAAGGNSSDNWTTTCYTTTGTTGPTCNGDGDGQINWANGEIARLWQHLARAGLIEGTYNGDSTTTVPGLTNPGSRVSPTAFWRSNWSGVNLGSSTTFAGNRGHFLSLFPSPSATSPLSPEEAWNIDTKMDDGFPALGRVIMWKGTVTYPCTSRADQAVDAVLDAAATYNFSVKDKICGVIIQRALQ